METGFSFYPNTAIKRVPPVISTSPAALFFVSLSFRKRQENATVTICHTKTEDLPAVCRQAQILAAAAGRPRMLGRDHVGKGAAVLDVGINVDPDGNLCGDVDLAAIEDIAAAATPVPGGIGAVTTAVLARHTALAAGRRQKAAKGWPGRG